MRAAIATCGIACVSHAAPPFITVPWNGHPGAASFTFDDAIDDQIENLTPILEAMPNVRVTFFLSSMGMDVLYRNAAGFAKLAQMGNEIGNHTKNHKQLPNLQSDSVKIESVDFADEIEKVMADNGATVKVTAHATPFCGNSEKVSEIISQRHFINRDGGWNGRHNWDEEPRWFNMDARSWYTFPNSTLQLLNALDTAAYIGDFASSNPWYSPVKGPSWIVLLNHGVSDAGDYSIKPEVIKAAFERAINNGLWVAPFSTVGAYYRAHFTLDTAKAVEAEEGFSVQWEMPSENMPQSIPLKVVLNTKFIKEFFDHNEEIIVEQDGTPISPDKNGTYILEFTALKANIRKKTEPPPQDSTNSDSFVQKSLPQKRTSAGPYSVFDPNGKNLGTTNNSENTRAKPRGVYFIKK